MALEIDLIEISGPWSYGCTLDRQTVKSVPTGYNAYGHMQYDTTRTPLGELVYRLKNKGDKDAIEPIAEVVKNVVRGWRTTMELVIPAPPSSARDVQPVVAVSRCAAKKLNIDCCEDCIHKVKSTSQMKNVGTWDERKKALDGAFVADPAKIGGRRILLLDDLFESGATLRGAAQALLGQGKAKSVHAIALTRTKIWSK